jgi:hypothetical protein
MELGSEENMTCPDRICSVVRDAVDAGKIISIQADLVYQVEILPQGVNSGASIDQYFRWFRVTRDSRIEQHISARLHNSRNDNSIVYKIETDPLCRQRGQHTHFTQAIGKLVNCSRII